MAEDTPDEPTILGALTAAGAEDLDAGAVSTELSHGQFCRVYGPRRERPVPGRVETPLGTADVLASFATRDDWGFETERLPCPTRFGLARASYSVQGRGGAVPAHVELCVSGGADNWGEPVGDPVSRGGRMVAWCAWVALDPASGLALPGRPARIGLQLYEASPRGANPWAFADPVDDKALEADVAAEVMGLVEGWAKRLPGHVARIHAAMVTHRLRELDLAVLSRRDALARALADLDAARAAVRDSEWAAQGREPMVRTDRHAPSPPLELRGMADAPAYDPQDIDEVVATLPASLHLETMDVDSAWMGVTFVDGRRLSVRMQAVGGKLRIGAEIDDEGLS